MMVGNDDIDICLPKASDFFMINNPAVSGNQELNLIFDSKFYNLII